MEFFIGSKNIHLFIKFLSIDDADLKEYWV